MSFELYWQENALSWDRTHYESPILSRSLYLAHRKRLRTASTLILKHTPDNSRVVELGAGTGRLLSYLGRLRHYEGLDVCPEVIAAATQHYNDFPLAVFHCASAATADLSRCDVLVGLGIADWLTAAELSSLLARSSARYLILSYTLPSFRFGAYALHRLWNERVRHRLKTTALCYDYVEIAAILRQAGFICRWSFSTGVISPGRILFGERQQ